MNQRKLDIHLVGAAVKSHSVSVDDFVRLVQNVQLAVKRLGQRIAGQQGKKSGRMIKDVEAACSLQVLAISKGSVSVSLGLPPPPAQGNLFGDTGDRALGRFIDGMLLLEKSTSEWPAEFEPAVLDPILEVGRVLKHGVQRIEFRHGLRGHRRVVRYTQKLRDKIERKIQSPTPEQISLTGFLLEVDFKDKTAEIHPTLGEVVRISFPAELEDIVLEGAKRQVRVIGLGHKEPAGRISKFQAVHLEILDSESLPEDLKAQPTLYEIRDPFAGIEILRDTEKIFAGFPDDRDAAQIISDLQSLRKPRRFDQ